LEQEESKKCPPVTDRLGAKSDQEIKMHRKYYLEKIRDLLIDGFSDEELRDLCYYIQDFKPVYNRLAKSSNKTEIINRLVEHADQKELLEKLLAQAKDLNPNRYDRYKPYYEEVPPPPPVSAKAPPAPTHPGEIPPDKRDSAETSSPERLPRRSNALLWAGLIGLLLIIGAVMASLYFFKPQPSLEIATPTLLDTSTPGSGMAEQAGQSQPQFEIAALNTLENDPNAYEVTDHLIWNQKPDQLAAYGVSITFTLEVRPTYNGSQHFGKVIALISGDNGQTIEKNLWDDFTSAANTQQIELSLTEILRVSSLGLNSAPTSNPFQVDGVTFPQTSITVQIVRASDKSHPLANEKLVIRNSPWDVRAALVWRQGQWQADVLVKNLGGSGEFAIRYRLARLDNEIDTRPGPEVNGAKTLTSWFEPDEFVRLELGASFTHTTTVPDQTEPGRYLLEAYVIKKQNYVQFNDEATWQDLNTLKAPWWFGEYPSQRLLFVVPLPKFEVNPLIQAEIDRLKNEQRIDLGLPTGPAEELTSGIGSKGWRQVFRGGEVYLYNNQTYALYGPILEHYQKLGGVQYEMGFPISSFEVITSSSGITATMMKFEGIHTQQPPGIIYASAQSLAGTWGKIGELYEQLGGPAGWLGLPLADGQNYYTQSTSQMFEYGYIIYHYPEASGGPDWSRPPIAYPYLASRGTLFDVQVQSWQDTGIQVKPGDRITIIQMDGTWTYREGVAPFDANGTSALSLQADAIIPSEPVGTLVGRVGEGSDQLFSVGRWKEFQAPAEGNLYLAMNDNGYGDNAGFITVQIMVEPAKQE
jgi:hypothetical protein